MISFEVFVCLLIYQKLAIVRQMDVIRDWNLLFSNEALCRVHSAADRHKRAPGVPCIMNVITCDGIGKLMRELHMSPSLLIGHLQSIGWAGRLEFVERLSNAYNWCAMEQGG